MTTDPARYDAKTNEAAWQKRWDDAQAFRATEDPSRPKYYVLEMFPYPSGKIHMGHMRNYTLGDVVARFKKAQGFNVLHPMGWDAFGLPAENAAIERNVHPGAWTYENIAHMRGQLKSIGLSYDWQREIATCHPGYYRHEQKFFLDMLKHGLAYRKESFVNWDPIDNTVLANEQVVDGRGWRSGALVERRKLSQWFLKISAYADDLLKALDTLPGWPDKVRVMQEKWIGRSEGMRVFFDLVSGPQKQIEVYTTRPDTLFGASFIAISANHPLVESLTGKAKGIEDFVKECNALGTSEEAIEKAEKKGFDTGLKVRHPLDPEWLLPVYIANFVLMDYGTGAVFGCPAHDQRDLDFARKYKLPVLPVVRPKDAQDITIENEAFAEDGILFNSRFLDGLSIADAKKTIAEKLESQSSGKRVVNYRLRDWGVSRQRYWGCPIPIIYCDDCSAVPVPEKDLPVELPQDVTFDAPGNPLDRHPTWKHVPCPTCGKAARRETDTFDTFFESSWYPARYINPRSELPIEPKAAAYWLPVDRYIGGIEHAVLHLLYARFFTRALKTCGYLTIDEPFTSLLTQGMVCHETYKDSEGKWLYPEEVVKSAEGVTHASTKKPVTVGRSEKMSKSKRNTVDPAHIIESYGADTARLFMMSDSPPERDLEWTDSGIDGAWRYVSRLWRFYSALLAESKPSGSFSPSLSEDVVKLRKATHKTIAAVTQDIEDFHLNKAVARVRELTNLLFETAPKDNDARLAIHECANIVLQLLNPMIPHLTEELWQQVGHSAQLWQTAWPKADPSLLTDDSVTLAVQVNGKLRATLELPLGVDEATAKEAALATPNVVAALEGKQIRKVILVPNKILNLVAA